MKRAVVFFSLSGNTKEAAEFISKETGADLFQIELVKPMPDSMPKQMMRGGMQSTFGMKPDIKGVPENISDYDEIILGTPIWAGKAASPVNTFISKYGIENKVTAVFTFSGGGDNDKCILKLSQLLKNMKNQIALADRNSNMADKNSERLKEFVKSILH